MRLWKYHSSNTLSSRWHHRSPSITRVQKQLFCPNPPPPRRQIAYMIISSSVLSLRPLRPSSSPVPPSSLGTPRRLPLLPLGSFWLDIGDTNHRVAVHPRLQISIITNTLRVGREREIYSLMHEFRLLAISGCQQGLDATTCREISTSEYLDEKLIMLLVTCLNHSLVVESAKETSWHGIFFSLFCALCPSLEAWRRELIHFLAAEQMVDTVVDHHRRRVVAHVVIITPCSKQPDRSPEGLSSPLSPSLFSLIKDPRCSGREHNTITGGRARRQHVNI